MVVLVLIGIITSFAVLSVEVGPGPAAAAAERLQAVLRRQSFEAALLGVQRGLYFDRDGYTVLQRRRDGGWSAQGERRPLGPGLVVQLSLQGRPISLDARHGVAAELQPQVLFLSSGEATDFNLRLNGAGEQLLLHGDLFGRISQQQTDR